MPHWTAPKMWEGGECWVIGGGPSMAVEFGIPKDVVAGVLSEELSISSYSPFLSPIHDKHVIGVNAAFLLGSWIDVVFFGDGGFYFLNKVKLDKYPKVKVTCNPNMRNKHNVHDVKYIDRDNRHLMGLSTDPRYLSWNLNSGAAAINLAYHFGVKTVYLLGFDMQVGEEGYQHWHRLYQKIPGKPRRDPKQYPFERHLKSFPMIANDAKRLGLEIINVSPNSRIENFKRVKLSDVL